MPGPIEFELNGKSIRLENCSPNLTLLEYLRAHGLTGAKEGCAEGDCGACSVVMLERDSRGAAAYRAFNSCLAPACSLAGRQLWTPEGLMQNGKPHPVQSEMIACHGSQCGYCTPGVVMSLFEGYYRSDLLTSDQLNDQLSGNLCRCTGYRPIRDAAAIAFRKRNGPNHPSDFFSNLLTRKPQALGPVQHNCAGENFFRPLSLIQLLRLLRELPDARLIAGATELGLEITKKYKRFSTLISTEAVPELRRFEASAAAWEIGGAVTLTEIEERLGTEFPAMGEMLRLFGSRQIRNRATMGGNIVTASPIGDSAPVLMALDAQVVLARLTLNGSEEVACRNLPISEFFLAYRKTALQPGEVLKTIVIPRLQARPGTSHCRFYKVSKRREMDISTVAGCFRVELDRRGNVQRARLAYGGVATMPVRALKTERALVGQPWSIETIQNALPILLREFSPISDVRGSAEYRQALIGSLLHKFYHDSCSTSVESDGADALALALPTIASAASLPRPHESAHKHVSGAAMYTDDLVMSKGALEVWPVCAPYAHARILKRDVSAAVEMPGIAAVLLAEDVPGDNNAGAIKRDEPLLAREEICFHGQLVALVVGNSQAQCRAAAERIVVEYQPLPAILHLREAVEKNSFHNDPNFIRRGRTAEALARAPYKLNGEFELGGQEHFYLETQAAFAEPGEDGTMLVTSSTQHPSEVQSAIAHVLNVSASSVVVQCPRLGGGFGGKETQAAMPAALAALGAHKTGRPVRVRWNRDQDMMLTGHRHPFLARFKVGFDKSGRLRAARIHIYSNGGWALDLSQAVTDRALFHLDNGYYIPSVEFRGQVARTHLSSNTAFRGFGGPQGMLIIEEILDRVARRLGLAPEVVRERNLYRGSGKTNTTHYGQQIGDNRLNTIWAELKAGGQLEERRKALAAWNAAHPHRKRGIALTPVKFGISFTVSHLNQAAAFVLIYQDGTVQVNHGAIEMGQGVHTNIAAIAARELAVPPEIIRVMCTSTDKVPNTSATAASCGTDLNGAAVQNACARLRARLLPVALQMLQGRTRRRFDTADVVFGNAMVASRLDPGISVPFSQVVRQAYLQRVSLSAVGYYSTPGIHWDRAAGRGCPFHYFACGAAISEVEVDAFTGMTRVLRADIIHDAGESINTGVNRGQIEGGFVQGMGWLTSEELIWNERGQLLTHSPDTYKIPSAGDAPEVLNVRLLTNARQESVVHGSKAVGEPPFMLAISVREAIRDAVAAFGKPGGQVPLGSPATSEAIFTAIRRRLEPAKSRQAAGSGATRHRQKAASVL
jgi:xanthine dehydrogenase large subunit